MLPIIRTFQQFEYVDHSNIRIVRLSATIIRVRRERNTLQSTYNNLKPTSTDISNFEIPG